MAVRTRAPQHAAPSAWKQIQRWIFYLTALGIAGVGNTTGLMHLLNWPKEIVIPVVIIIELFAVRISTMADDRRAKGENAYATQALAYVVALGVIGLQFAGHLGQPLVYTYLFCGSSALAFGIYVLDSNHRRRDRQYAESGERPAPDPRFGWYLWRQDRPLCLEARQIFRTTKEPDRKAPDGWRRLTGEECLARAREARLERERRAALLRLAREEMVGVYGEALVDMMILTAKPNEAAGFLADELDWRAQMRVFARRADPAKLDGAMAKAERDRHQERVAAARDDRVPDRVDAPRNTRSTRTPSTRSRAASTRAPGTRSRAAEDAPRDAWWNGPRDAFYAVYAQRLDETGVEVGGEELAGGVGIADLGNARTARGKYLRTRYADEVARGDRQPRDRVVLPAAVQSLVAERVARGMTGELRAIGGAQ